VKALSSNPRLQKKKKNEESPGAMVSAYNLSDSWTEMVRIMIQGQCGQKIIEMPSQSIRKA
jgi:hypothetical protein